MRIYDTHNLRDMHARIPDLSTSNHLVFSGSDCFSYGLCPKTAQAGDVVCVLFGGDVPFVVRPDPISGGEEQGKISVLLYS